MPIAAEKSQRLFEGSMNGGSLTVLPPLGNKIA